MTTANTFRCTVSALVLVLVTAAGRVALAEARSPSSLETTEVAGEVLQIQAPLPPAGSETLVRNIELRFPRQGNRSSVDFQTYLYYMEMDNFVSLPSQGKWVPYNEATERVILDDFRRLWDTGFLEDLWIDVVDEPWPNGVMGKRIVFNMEERQRVKIVAFEGSEKFDRGKIDENLQENGIVVRLDEFLDEGLIRRIKGVLNFMYSTEGYQFTEITHEITEMLEGPKVVQLTFHIEEGPKGIVQEIEFIGNVEVDDSELKGHMKNIRERYWLSWLTRRGTYKAVLFEEDADRIVEHYLDQGFIQADVGQPEVEYLGESEDGTERLVRLRIPVQEGERYRIGEVVYEGNEVLTEAGMGFIFRDLEPGEYYSEGDVRAAFELAREVYGARGYYEMTIFPDLKPRTATDASVNGDGNGNGNGTVSGVHEDDAAADEERLTHLNGSPLVDVVIRVQEGEQYFINRIVFKGNTTTHDEVIRRELSLQENGVFNTNGLKYSVRRLNQLGYFEQFEEADVDVAHIEGSENEVDVTFELSEAHLNQLTFGAGVSQFDGFFGQMSFQTQNFLGRGKNFSIGLQRGSRVKNYSVGFTEPYLFTKPISAGLQLYSREINWLFAYQEQTKGGSVTLGFPLSYWTRGFLSYSYEETQVGDISPFLFNSLTPGAMSYNPFLTDAILLGSGGRRTVGRITPSIRYNTVDHPIFPNSGQELSASLDLAGVGGNTKFLKPSLSGTWYTRHTDRTIIGFRVQWEVISADNPDQIPVFERLWSGGEYSVRGFDIRRIGPTVSDLNPDVSADSYQGRMVIGGNKSLVVNAEYQFTLSEPVRLILFYDAGQVQDFKQKFTMKDFKTSTGVELRFFMPMLNVPFRLIYSWNPQRDGVYNNEWRPQEKTTVRFAVGTTF